jgi:hypothetical protein
LKEKPVITLDDDRCPNGTGWVDLDTALRSIVHEVACRNYRNTSSSREYYDGIKLLFRSSQGLTVAELHSDIDKLFCGAGSSPLAVYDPVFELYELVGECFDRRRFALVLRRALQNGEIVFGALARPRKGHAKRYREEATEIIRRLNCADLIMPGELLTDWPELDLQFYQGLADRLVVYRGATRSTIETEGLGICWTTSRELASNHAALLAANSRDAIVMEAHINKESIATVYAANHMVVALPDVVDVAETNHCMKRSRRM